MSPTRRARRLHFTASTSPRHALETLAQERECRQHRRPAKDRDKSGEIFFLRRRVRVDARLKGGHDGGVGGSGKLEGRVTNLAVMAGPKPRLRLGVSI